MTTSAQYQHKLSELDLAPLSQPLSADTRPALETLQGQLRQIEQDINRELHLLRTQFQSRIDSVLNPNSQTGSGRKRTEQVERLERERDAKIAPFQAVRDSVTDLLQKVEAALTAAG
jgi:hypothetical protein